MSAALEQVRQYYDSNTEAFIRHGQGSAFDAIHRAVWGPGVHDERGAFHFVDELILDRLRPLAADGASVLHVVDLGCGVAASLRYLAAVLPIRGTGITLSPVQAATAARRIAAAGLSDRVQVLTGDYCALPARVQAADLALAIESFLHVLEPARFFAECARLIRRGGLLVLCDDMLGERASAPEAQPWLARFRRGWHVHSLLSAAQIAAAAAAHGFVQREVVELTPYLQLGRPRDVAIAALMRAAGWLPIQAPSFHNMLGGHALQVCLKRGYVNYSVLVFERA